MRDINKNKIIVNNKNHKRLIGSEQRANEKVNYDYSEKKSYVDYTKRKKKQDYFTAHINNVDFSKKLPF